MKKNIIFLIAATLLFVACSKNLNVTERFGYLSFNGCGLEVDTDVSTKATSPASGNYTILVADKTGVLDTIKTDYKTIQGKGNKIPLPAGNYTVIARSEEKVPGMAFEQPVYGVQKDVSIKSGEETSIGEMVCRLLQVKVTVDYSEEFLAMVTGPCTATVSVSPLYPLVYNVAFVDAKAIYDHSAGYFALNEGTGTTMKVVFEGNVEGGNKKMTHTFENIKPCTWHKIKFVKKMAIDGKASFSISIVDNVEDIDLVNDITGIETEKTE